MVSSRTMGYWNQESPSETRMGPSSVRHAVTGPAAQAGDAVGKVEAASLRAGCTAGSASSTMVSGLSCRRVEQAGAFLVDQK
jgi:hypothetical protein